MDYSQFCIVCYLHNIIHTYMYIHIPVYMYMCYLSKVKRKTLKICMASVHMIACTQRIKHLSAGS